MNRSTFNKAVVPGLFAFMIQGYTPASGQDDWKKVVSTRTSSRAYEEAAYAGGLGIFPHKPEGEAITYDEILQGPGIFRGSPRRNSVVNKRAISENTRWGNSEERLLCILN